MMLATATVPMPGVESAGQPLSSTTIPQAAAHPFAQGAPGYAHPRGAGQGNTPDPVHPSYPPFTIPPTSSMPPGAMQQQQMHEQQMLQMQQMQQQQMQQMQQQQQQQMQSMHPSPPLQQLQPPSGSFDPQLAAAERPSNAPAGAGQYVMAITIGVLLAVLIGVGGFLVLKHRRVAPAVDVAPMVDTKGTPGVVGATCSNRPAPS